MKKLAPSELVLNPDGSVYHLKLKPENIGKKIIVVGDPGRVALISSYFDSVECKISNREFVTHTGIFKGERVSAIATGIGTDNIDIVLNELDALVNIDLENRTVKKKLTSLEIVRIGTCGAMQKELPVDSFVMSKYGLGMDGLLNFYQFEPTVEESTLLNEILAQTNYSPKITKPYLVKGSELLINKLGQGISNGITATAPGFYGPQGRVLRLELNDPTLNDKFSAFKYEGEKVVNFEMETSALYGLSRLLGHEACTLCVIVANRLANEFSKDYHPAMTELIQLVLARLTTKG
jgi:uridine phosphorylase